MSLGTMEWGDDPRTKEVFFSGWAASIRNQDPCGYDIADGDVYSYLKNTLCQVLTEKTKIKEGGWAFRVGLLHEGRTDWSRLFRCVVWGNGYSSEDQRKPMDDAETKSLGFEWWPCVVCNVGGDILPFYCPALAWNKSRPWVTHRSRIFLAYASLPPPPMLTQMCPAMPPGLEIMDKEEAVGAKGLIGNFKFAVDAPSSRQCGEVLVSSDDGLSTVKPFNAPKGVQPQVFFIGEGHRVGCTTSEALASTAPVQRPLKKPMSGPARRWMRAARPEMLRSTDLDCLD
jgi:hypothetical protein